MKIFDLLSGERVSLMKNAIIWLLIYIMVLLPFGLEIATAFVIPLIIPVHVNYYLIDKYLKNKKYVTYGIYAGLLAVLFGLVARGLSTNIILSKFDHISPIIKEIPEEVLNLTERPVLRFTFNPLIVMLLTSLYKFFQEKQLNIIQELKTQRLRAELDFLKGQINPHFLFNTLNNLFSMSTSYGDEETAAGIGHLSHLMRYMLYDTNSDYVRLDNEIEMLNNFIDLQKLRMNDNNKSDIEFIVNGEVSKKQIPPMLLIPFVENAFKHGYSVNSEFLVSINLSIYNDDLHFSIENSINRVRERQNMDSSGIGLENVRKRLDLLYKDEYLLEINEKNNKYIVSLTIPITN